MGEPRKAARGEGRLLVDKVLVLQGGRRGVGLKNVSANEPDLQGRRSLPEALVVEALVQMTAIVLASEEARGPARLARVRKMEFKRPVRPGEQLILYSEIAERSEGSVRARVRAEVDGETVAEGELDLAVKGGA